MTALCIGTAAGAAVCVAGGIVPSPLAAGHERPAQAERHLTEAPTRRARIAKVEYGTAPAPAPEPKPSPKPKSSPSSPEPPAESEPAPEPAPVLSSETVEYEPSPAPEPEPAPVASPAGDTPAGEFGP